MASPLVLSVQDASIRYHDKVIFEEMSFNIHEGNKIALVGRNGAGKTTLMHMITGTRELDAGERWQEQGTTVGYLRQDVTPKKGQTVFSYIFEEIKAEDKVTQEYKVESVCDALQIDSKAQMTMLSGGQLRRAALARALVEEPSILLLDEPTNHLDLEAIEWLEDYLKGWRGTLMCVSHDRTFLSNITNKVFWLDRGTIRVSPKGFSHFEEWSDMLLQQEARELQNRKQIVAREVEWASRGVKARVKRNQRRLELVREMRDKLKEDQSAYNRVVSKIDLPPPKDADVSSRIVAEFYNVNKSFENESGTIKILDKFNMRIKRGDRIGILGKNGSGKTTFLKLLMKQIEPDSGSIKIAKNAEISYFDQKRSDLNPEDTMWKTLCPGGGDYVDVMGKSRHVCGYLKSFLFDPQRARDKVATLSGGEKNRLMLAKVLANPGNLLILDEPTNDLDMDTLDMLEEILSNYTGTLFVVSHDRDFLDQTVTKIIAFEGSAEVEGYIGGYSDYLEASGRTDRSYMVAQAQEEVKKAKPKTAVAESTPQPKTKPKKLSYKLEFELKKLPAKMEKLEKEIKELNEKLADPDFYMRDKDGFHEATQQLQAAQDSLERKERRWLELEEMKLELESA